MTLSSGEKFGPFEVVSRLGAGGMGEVYRARDPRLAREVAIKVLPESFAKDADFLARFQVEARAASALNHPNIITIHDIGTVGETPYILMELVDGQTLRELLKAGPLPIKKLLNIAAQVAEGLAAAHARGIVHRDLKPENLMVTREGVVKLLDFGLARPLMAPPDSDSASSAEEQTVTALRATEPGTILGTVGYMSPEQASGRPADFRSDQFSLGSVLYEMATGQRAWKRSTPIETLVAILREDVEPIARVAPQTPTALCWIVERCLARDPEDRYASTRDLARDLRQVAEHLSEVTRAPASGAAGVDRPARAGSRAAWVAFLSAGVALGAISTLLLRQPARFRPPVSRYLTYSGRDGEPSVSPDGRFVAFSSERNGPRRIWLKQLSDGSEIALTSGPDRAPRFTPDGAAVLFTRLSGSLESIYRVPAVGGEARRVIENGGSPDPSPDGREIAFIRPASRSGIGGYDLVVAAVNGGSESVLHHVVGLTVIPPRWSPDGRFIALPHSLTGAIGGSPFPIALVPREKGEVRVLTPAGEYGLISSALWVNEGRELLYAQLDPGFFSTSGRIVSQNLDSGVVRILHRGLNLGPQLDLAGPGRLIYEATVIRSNLVEAPVALPPARPSASGNRWLSRANSVDRQPFYSPDGRRVVFTSNREGNMDIWEMTLASGSVRRLTDNPADDWDPYLSRDGKYLLWSSKRSGNYEVWIANADGTEPRQLSRDGVDAENPAMAPDGQGGEWVYYGSYGSEKSGIWRMRLDGSGAMRVIAGTLRDPSPSPDGNYVGLIDASDTDHFRIRVARIADGAFVSFSLDTSLNPATGTQGARIRWMPDGRSLIFGGSGISGNGVYVQAFDPDRDTTATRKQVATLDSALAIETFAVSPDGRRLVLSATEQPSDLVLVEGLAGIEPPRRRPAP